MASRRGKAALAWVNNRLGTEELMEDQYNRIVPIHATNYIYCFGGIAFVLFLILAITGIMLAVYYQPTPDGAYQSVVNISTNVQFGWWIRSIHKWAAGGMVLLVVRPHAARLLHRRLQGAARAELADRRRAAAHHPGLRLHRLPAARGTRRPTGPPRSAPTSPARCRSSGTSCS